MTENSGLAFAASAAWLAPSLALCLIFATPALGPMDVKTPDAGKAEAGMQRFFVEDDHIDFAGYIPREDDDISQTTPTFAQSNAPPTFARCRAPEARSAGRGFGDGQALRGSSRSRSL